MNFYTVRDLRTTTKSIWDNLSNDGEVIITNNGKPTALIIDIADGDFEETIKAVRQAKATIAFNSMRSRPTESGFIADAEIEAELLLHERRNKIRLLLQTLITCVVL